MRFHTIVVTVSAIVTDVVALAVTMVDLWTLFINLSKFFDFKTKITLMNEWKSEENDEKNLIE